MPDVDERPLTIDVAPGVQLEALIHEAPSPACAALVLHPHPQYGGDMHNHVVEALCGALAARGATTLRLNFRGTGHSGGAYDGGRGEVDDARAALAALRSDAGTAPVVMAGYSFGAQVAAALAAEEPVDTLMLVSPPLVDGRSLPGFPQSIAVLAVAGDRDPVCPADRLQALESDTATIVIVPDADHSWWGHTRALTELVAEMKFAKDVSM